MYNDEVLSELNRLKFEDFLWLVFVELCIINVYNDKEYLKINNIFRII